MNLVRDTSGEAWVNHSISVTQLTEIASDIKKEMNRG